MGGGAPRAGVGGGGEARAFAGQAGGGRVPADSVEPVRAAAPPTPAAVAEVEAVTEHDVVAFLTAWADNTRPRSAAAYVPLRMTPSDLLDTAPALPVTQSPRLLLTKAGQVSAA